MSQIDGETYFNNFGQSGYDELKEWTPAYYQKIKEADEIGRASCRERV